MTRAARPLEGLVVNLSVSQGDDTLKHGYPGWQVNRVALQFVAALYGQGASLVFGHDWREDGVMEAVHGFALQMQPQIPLETETGRAEGQPRLRNLLPWPETPSLSQEEQEQLSSTLMVETAGLPEELRQFDVQARAEGANSKVHAYLRARGLTFLRRKLTNLCNARVCIGGPRSGSQGRYPGLVEEALLAVRHNKPLYLASLLGGASEQVVASVEGQTIPDDFCPPTPLEALYRQPPVDGDNPEHSPDQIMDRAAIWREFSDVGREGIARINRLSMEENNDLLHTLVVERAIDLVLTGLSRIRQA